MSPRMSRDRRRSERWTYLDFVRFEARGRAGDGRLLNVARTGVFVGTSDSPSVGESVRLVLDRVSPVIEVAGMVRWSGVRVSDGAQGFGVELQQPCDAYLELVERVAVREPNGTGRRPAPRVSISLPVAIEYGNFCDEGLLSDISLSGACLEKTALTPEDGAEIRLTFALSLEEEPFDLVCRVVRSTDQGGYAVEFEAVDARLKAAVDHAAELVRNMPEIG